MELRPELYLDKDEIHELRQEEGVQKVYWAVTTAFCTHTHTPSENTDVISSYDTLIRFYKEL